MPDMTEAESRYWATVFAGVTAAGLVLGGLFALIQYNSTREDANRTANIQVTTAQFDAKRPFFTRQLELCESAAGSAAVLADASARSSPDVKKAAEEFWRLYWGPLGIVEDEAVEASMVQFGMCLKGDSACKVPLTRASLNLAHACRALISKSWNLDLPPIQKK